MQRWTAILLLALVAGAMTLVVLKGGARPVPVALADAGAPDAGDASVPVLLLKDAAVDLLDGGELGPEPSGSESPATPAVDAGGTVLLNGEPAPPVGADAPKTVTFGAILITYRGAQGAPTTARPREAALALANELLPDAKADFKAAVAKGDKGSMENLGRIPRGFLEPAPEYVLFSLGKGEVGGPIDTPRGYWIVQRIE
jgi:hypothetical protein